MLVKSQCAGNRVTGLVVGENNVRRYFPRKVKAINLKLDHLMIECGLASRFWDGEPEIHDPRLCLWLESKQLKDSNCRVSVPFDMTPTGEGAFTLGYSAPKPPARERAIRAGASNLEFKLQNMKAGAAA